MFAYGPADATAVPKPHHLLPQLNPDWFYLSGTGLPRLSWTMSTSMSMWSLRLHFTNESVTGTPYSINSYSLSHGWTLRGEEYDD